MLSTSDADSAAAITAELEAAGHTVTIWEPGTPVPAEARLAIVDGLEQAVLAHDAPCDLVVLVELAEVPLFPELPRQLTDFVITPVRAGELLARVGHLATQPTLAERARQAVFALAVEASSDVVELTRPDAVIEYVNLAYERTLGFTAAEAVGKTPAQLVRSDAHTPEFFRELDATLKRGDVWRGTLISRARDGRYVHLDSSVTPVANRKGQITHHLGIKRDITEQIERQEALLEANRALEQARDAAVSASRAKSEFLANMSHELRTPLNAIIGYSEMLMEDFDAADQVHKDLVRIRAAGAHLLTLINDVLDISKIEADKIELAPHRFPLRDLVDDVAATIVPMARTSNDRFEIEVSPEVGEIFCDRTRLRQILLNLLSNACKFTRDGQVTLAASRAQRHGEGWIDLQVRDTGIGISAEQQRRLFQPFVQADSSTTREFGGTGLGLVISRRLAEMMGGEITMASVPGQGSTFTVSLPADRDHSRPEIRLGMGEGPRVLLIDDDPEVRDLFGRLLARRGFDVAVADSGAAGLELASRLVPDAIVLDVKMPGMSGWEVLSTLKISQTTADIPVIMMTVMHQREVGHTLGAADYLIKPIEPDRLVALLRRYTSPGASVLVVEDDEPTRELIRRTLERSGNKVTEAENGQVALAQVAAAPPDVIVLDLMMPVMDGFSFLHALRGDPRYADLPVIVATARTLDEQERRDLTATVQDVIEKGAHTRHELIDLISDQIVRLVDRRDAATKP
ncbi:MAG: response regulator [Kofleriaceae bacterium]|nr:response regulator [Myxococcales bacterium]MCB9562841.1 response regulator [Kofleriaceae bacterium]MCB9575033.1 response regulator [Kofleriaceae bacterium]